MQTRTKALLLFVAFWLLFVRGDAAPLVAEAPIKAKGLHVLIVEESSHRTPEVASILSAARWQKLVPAGQWRVIDPSDQATLEYLDKKWRDALERERGELPWLIVSGNGGYEGPLESVDQIVSQVEAHQ